VLGSAEQAERVADVIAALGAVAGTIIEWEASDIGPRCFKNRACQRSR
jgi:hypothetical protein